MKILTTLILFGLIVLALILSIAGWTWPRDNNPFTKTP